MGTRRRLLIVVEIACWTIGLAGLVWYGVFHLGVAIGTQQNLERFAASRVPSPNSTNSTTGWTITPPSGTPDQSLWSPIRVRAWRDAIVTPLPAPLAVLRIPKIRLEVPVLPGTDDRILDRAVGHIEDTAEPGADGNSGLAGHRDGFFRGLKDIAVGDLMELDTRHGKEVYRVERTWIVDPNDVSVLDPTPTPTLTLVTCYPFYFVGSAPQRFIVRAVHIDDRPGPIAAIH